MSRPIRRRGALPVRPRSISPLALALVFVSTAAPSATAQDKVISVNSGLPRDPTTQLFFTVSAKTEDINICGFTVFVQPDFRYLEEDLPLIGDEGNVDLIAWGGLTGASESSEGAWIEVAAKTVPPSSSLTPFYLPCVPSIFIPAGVSRKVSIAALRDPQYVLDSGLRIEEPVVPGFEENDDVLVLAGVANSSGSLFSGATEPAQLLGLVHYTVGSDFCVTGGLPVEVLPSNPYDGNGGPLVAGRAYVVAAGSFGWAQVPPGMTLTAEKGAVIKLGDGVAYADRINVKGVANFEDTIVTSIRDDEIGGDTDGQLGLPQAPPAKGDFEGIHFEFTSTGSSWLGGLLRFAGAAPNLASLHLNGTDAVIDGLVISDCGVGNGFVVDANESGSPTVTNTGVLFSEAIPYGGFTVNMLIAVLNNIALSNSPGDYLQVSGTGIPGVSTGPTVVTTDAELTPANYPGDVVVFDGSITVDTGAKFAINPGVTIKFTPNKNATIEARAGSIFEVNGTGAFPVQFGSLGNDSLIGDTDKNGVSTSFPGDFRGIRFTSGSSGKISHANISDGGDLSPSLNLQSADVTADSIRIENSGQHGINLQALDGNLTNVFVKGSAADGIRLPSGSPGPGVPKVVHATVLDSGADGMRTVSGTYPGEVVNSISYGNGGSNFGLGTSSSNVKTSLGDFFGVNGNLDEDPQLDAAGKPLPGSPVLDKGTTDFTVPHDLNAAGRTLVGGFLNPGAMPEMGAFESTTNEMTSTPFSLGEELSFKTVSTTDPGALIAYLGGLPSSLYVPGFGLIGFNLIGHLPLGVGVENVEFKVDLPATAASGNSLVGIPYAIQGFVVGQFGILTPTNVIGAEFIKSKAADVKQLGQ